MVNGSFLCKGIIGIMKKVFLGMCIFLLVGCDFEQKPYKIEQLGEQQFLLNQKTGDAYIIKDESLLKLDIVSADSIDNGKVITYNNTIAENKLKIDLKVKLLSGVALYNLTVGPTHDKQDNQGKVDYKKTDFKWYEKLVTEKDAYKYINIELTDKDGFKIFTEKQNIQNSFTRIVDSDGKTDAFQYNGHFNIPSVLSAIATNVSITYNL